jgi:hypothetical protein
MGKKYISKVKSLIGKIGGSTSSSTKRGIKKAKHKARKLYKK